MAQGATCDGVVGEELSLAGSSPLPGSPERRPASLAMRRGRSARPTSCGSAVCLLGWGSNQTNLELVRQWRRLGLDATLLSPLEARATLRRGAVALGRIDVLETLDGVEAGLLALLWLERCGVCVLNCAAALIAVHDKLVTAHRLGLAGLPHPRTACWGGEGDAPIRPPLVLKPRFGSWGRDVFRCRDDVELERTLAAVRTRPWFRRHGALLQELVPPRGYDLRLIVAGGEVVGAVERVAAAGEWRTNVSLGGSLRPAVLSPEVRSLAIAAASAVGADLAGVDLMPVDRGGHVVLELNGAVDFDARYSLGGGDVYLEVARALGLPVDRRRSSESSAAGIA
jgi:RimK family alpha-L-glutamate ligase